MDCDICMIEWDSSVHIPRLLSCGHSFCETCLLGLLSTALNKNTFFYCPTCMVKHKDIQSETDIKSLIKNFNLLRIVEKIESRKSQLLTQHSMISEKNLLPIEKQSNSQKINLDKRGSNDKNTMCKIHNLPLLYIGNKNVLLCETCVKTANINYVTNPKIIKEMKGKIDNTLTKVGIIKYEIERLRDFLTSYHEEFESSNKKKIDDLFQYLNKVITSNYNSALHLLEQCKAEQQEEIDSIFGELEELQKELLKIETELSFAINTDEKNIPQYNRKVNKISEQLNSLLNYNMELNLLAMKIGIKEEMKHKIFNLFQDTYSVEVEFATINGESPTVKHILQKDKYWVCVCGEFNNPFASVRCISCERFIKLESIPHIIDSPMEANVKDIDLLIIRRKEECKEFHEKYNYKSLNDKQYIIDIDWFLNWKCFVTNDLTEKYLPDSEKLFSTNNKIGILSPGPIMNGKLLDNQKNLRKNISNNEDYILVNEPLWIFMYKNYGGGPEILFKSEILNNKIKINTSSENIKHSGDEKKCINKQFSSIDDSKQNNNKIIIKNENKTYIQETKFENIETESIRNEQYTIISEGNVNEVYSNKYNSNVNLKKISNNIDAQVEIAVPQKLNQMFNYRNTLQIKGKK